MNHKLVPLVLLVGCSASEATSTYFTTRSGLARVLAAQCGDELHQWFRGLRLQRPPQFTFYCNAFIAGGMKHFTIDTFGDTAAPTGKVCELRFGPAMLASPLESFDFIRPWFEDPAVADRILQAVGPPARGLIVQKLVEDKYRVAIRIDYTDGAAKSLLFEIDACERRASESFVEIDRFVLIDPTLP